MSVETDKIIAHLEKASADLKAAVDEFASSERLTVIESYIMGHLRAAQAVTKSASDFVTECGVYKNSRANKKSKDVQPEPDSPPGHTDGRL